jgi:D-sedoheptulose 7-phosphate isomerase
MDYKHKIESSIKESIATKQAILDENTIKNIEIIGKKLAEVVQSGKKILFCGNGGSAADSQHLAAELVVRLRSSYERPAIPAIALTVDTSILTAGGNDYGFNNIFSRQIEALAQTGDALIAISTSGNSENVIRAIEAAKSKELTVIGFLGGNGGKIAEMCDYSFISPSSNTARIQETHIMIGHILCEIIEEECYQKN